MHFISIPMKEKRKSSFPRNFVWCVILRPREFSGFLYVLDIAFTGQAISLCQQVFFKLLCKYCEMCYTCVTSSNIFVLSRTWLPKSLLSVHVFIVIRRLLCKSSHFDLFMVFGVCKPCNTTLGPRCHFRGIMPLSWRLGYKYWFKSRETRRTYQS